MQPTAQAVGGQERRRSPGRGERPVSYIRQYFAASDLSTQGRRPLIKPDFRAGLFAYLGGIVREMQGTALIINGVTDHVHMLLRIRPAQSAAEVARVVKANSSKWVREKWSSDFAWQTGYGVFSVSESNATAVTKYIADQEEHHKKHSFQEEFLAFLKKNHVGYDEKYIWG